MDWFRRRALTKWQERLAIERAKDDAHRKMLGRYEVGYPMEQVRIAGEIAKCQFHIERLSK